MLSAFLLNFFPLLKRDSITSLPCGEHQPGLGCLPSPSQCGNQPVSVYYTQSISQALCSNSQFRDDMRISSGALPSDLLREELLPAPLGSPQRLHQNPCSMAAACSWWLFSSHSWEGRPVGLPVIPGHKTLQPFILPAQQGTPSSHLPEWHLLVFLPRS